MDAKSEPGTAKLTLTVEQAGYALGLSRASTYAAIKRNEIPHLRIGRRLVIPRAAFYQLLGIEGEV